MNCAGVTKDGNFEEAGVYGAGMVGDLFELYIRQKREVRKTGKNGEKGGLVSLRGYWSAGSHRVSSPISSARCLSFGYNRQCAFAYRACSHIQTRTCSYRVSCRTRLSEARYGLSGTVPSLAWCL